MKKIQFLIASSLVAGLLAQGSPSIAAPLIEITPSTFDFGWAPDNAILSCDFTVKNVVGEMVPLTAVQPSCGCTATDFTPDGLASSEQTKIHITFNTRGYANIRFNKVVKVRAGSPEQDYQVNLAGNVTDSTSKVLPEGDGIAAFAKGMDRKQEIIIINKSDKAVDLSLIQEPASWAKIRASQLNVLPGQTVGLEVKVDGALDVEKQTSATFEAKSADSAYRFTVAVRTGVTPEPYRKIRQAPKAKTSPAPATPKTDKK